MFKIRSHFKIREFQEFLKFIEFEFSINGFGCQTFSSATSPVLVHVMNIEHSLLPDHVLGTVFQHMSIDLISPWTPSAAD